MSVRQELSYDPETFSSPNPFVDPSPLNGQPGRTKVALVGFMEQNERTAPYDDPEWDLWCFNMGNRLGFMHDAQGRFRADRWFDLHEEHAQDAKDLAWIHKCPVPLYLTHAFSDNPMTRTLDLVDLQMRLSLRAGRLMRCDYFASSYAYAMALALADGYTTIGFYGMDLDWGRERIVERGNLEYWMGVAEGLGVTLEIGPQCKLLTHPGLYGIEYDKERDAVLDLCAELLRQLMQSTAMRERLEQNLDVRIQELSRLARECSFSLSRLVTQSIKDFKKEFRP